MLLRSAVLAGLCLALAACGQSEPQGQAAVQPDMPKGPEAECSYSGGAISYADKLTKKIQAAVSAGTKTAKDFNDYLAKLGRLAEETRAKGDTKENWVVFCKAIDQWTKEGGY
jgi:hypothetical protein